MESKAAGPLTFSKIRPGFLHLPDTQEWRDRANEGRKHFKEQGIKNIFEVAGVHGKAWGIQGRFIYLRDNPAEQLYLGDGKTAGVISHYILYNVMKALPDEYFMVLEDDARFVDGWKEKIETALKDVPKDFDFLFVGSCCAEDKQPKRIKGDIYYYPHRPEHPDWYPQSGFCYIVAKKCLQHLIDTQRTTADPVDVGLIYRAFPKMKVYAILPRLADQGDTPLPR